MVVVALHGAFRGGWYFEPLADVLAERDVALVAPDLVGDDLSDWIDVVVRSITGAAAGGGPAGRGGMVARGGPAARGGRVTVLAHSMGGVVAQSLPAEVGERIARIVLLDAPLVEPGQRAVDVSSPVPVDDAVLPHRSFRVPPSPVGPEQGFTDPALAAWVNERLAPVPFGPQLDPVPAGLGRPPSTELVFLDGTPDGYPSALALARCRADGTQHRVLSGFHDAPVLTPALVADLLLDSDEI